MSKNTLLILPFLFGGVTLAGAPWAPAPAETVLKESDHEDLGELIADWVLAATNQHKKLTGLEAKENLRELLQKWSKKRGIDGRDPLSLTDDLGASLWYSFAYDKQKGIKKGKVAEIEAPTADGRTIEYGFWAPSKYRAQSGPYPLILCLPSEDEDVTEHLTEKWIDASIRDGAILASVPMPEDTADWTAYEGLGNFFAVFKDVTSRYAIDYDRIFIAGRGLGVATAMEIASQFPDRFAGIVGRTGDAAEIGPENFSNLPTFFAGAGKAATEFQKACEEYGHDNVTLEPAGQEPEVWAWVQDHPRISNPTRVTLHPGKPFPERAYWLQVPPTDVQALVSAEIDRATNTVTVDAKGVTQVILSFNDVLVDLDKPVKVVCNGVEHEDQLQRSLDTFLERVRLTSNDPGKLYTAVRVYDVPVKAEKAGGDAPADGGE